MKLTATLLFITGTLLFTYGAGRNSLTGMISGLKTELEDTQYERNVYMHNFKLCKHMLKVK